MYIYLLYISTLSILHLEYIYVPVYAMYQTVYLIHLQNDLISFLLTRFETDKKTYFSGIAQKSNFLNEND